MIATFSEKGTLVIETQTIAEDVKMNDWLHACEQDELSITGAICWIASFEIGDDYYSDTMPEAILQLKVPDEPTDPYEGLGSH